MESVHVTTDVLDVAISTRGGTLERVDLPAYALVKGEAARVRLENQDSDATLYQLQSGLTGPGKADLYPTHLALYTSPQTQYTLQGAELRVPLTWSADGITVVKTFVFHPGQYAIGLDYEVHNASAAPWAANAYAQILRNDPPTKRSMFNVDSYAFHGPALHDGTKYRKLDTSDAKDAHLAIDVDSGWVAALQHHFVSAIVPPPGAPWHFALQRPGPAVPAQRQRPGADRGAGGLHAVLADAVHRTEAAGAAGGHRRPSSAAWPTTATLWFLATPLFKLLAGCTGSRATGASRSSSSPSCSSCCSTRSRRPAAVRWRR